MQPDDRSKDNLIDFNPNSVIFQPMMYIDISEEIIVPSALEWIRKLVVSPVTSYTLRVPGAGFWGWSRGSTKFNNYRRLETSTSYNHLKREIQFDGGVMGFWNWLEGPGNVESNSEAVSKIFNELNLEQNISMELKWDMHVTGVYPNVPVEATTFIRLMQMKSPLEMYYIASNGAIIDDTGANDQNNIELPNQNNKSAITIV